MFEEEFNGTMWKVKFVRTFNKAFEFHFSNVSYYRLKHIENGTKTV